MRLKAALLSDCLKIKILLCIYTTYQEIQELWKFVKKEKTDGLKESLGKIVILLYFIVEQNPFFSDPYVTVNVMIENIHT